MQSTPKTIKHPTLNPRIQAGASLGYTALDELSFTVDLMAERWSQ
jgi:hypothetical protein